MIVERLQKRAGLEARQRDEFAAERELVHEQHCECVRMIDRQHDGYDFLEVTGR